MLQANWESKHNSTIAGNQKAENIKPTIQIQNVGHVRWEKLIKNLKAIHLGVLCESTTAAD